MCVPSVQFVRKAFGNRWNSLSTLIGDTVCIDKKLPVDGVEIGIDISDHLHAAFTTDSFYWFSYRCSAIHLVESEHIVVAFLCADDEVVELRATAS